jgi:lipopolysaccharide/colanic/teichoic acid biosynthesis glycosyltransferase
MPMENTLMENKKKQKELHGFNNPMIVYIIVNLATNSAIFYFMVDVFPFVNSNPVKKYGWPFFAYQFIWIMLGIAQKKYLSLKKQPIGLVVLRSLKADFFAVLFGVGLFIILNEFRYSVGFLLWLSVGFLLSEMILISIAYAFQEAQYVDLSIPVEEQTALNTYQHQEVPMNLETTHALQQLLEESGGEKLVKFLQTNIHLFVSSSLIIDTTNRFNIEKVAVDRYATIINLKKVNEIREINTFFTVVNDRLPLGGVFVLCFESKSQRKRRIIGLHPTIRNYLYYGMDYIFRRVLPKLNLTREFYFWVTNGTNRPLSKAEVLGRLYCCGFEFVNDRKINGISYVIAHKKNQPNRLEVFNFSPIIKLRRVGKDGKLIKVYKLRTMHPYSEYLQDYIYKHHNLLSGGKFRADIRVTTFGGFLRRYWLDELPMLVNLIKHDLKIVGVRPLSEQYFKLYSPELQQLRTRHRPGLLPPYYVDLPKNFSEIQASEQRYLEACEKHGTFITDVHYFFMIIYRILFQEARSR